MPDASRTFTRLMERQRAWAEAREVECDAEGRLRRWTENLLEAVPAATRAELGTVAPDETAGEAKPGRLHDLGSGLALAANVLAPWRDRLDELAARLPGLLPAPQTVRFAGSLSLGDAADDAPPSTGVDVLFEAPGDRATAVVPLFAEPFGDVDPRVGDALARDPGLWSGLHGCALLARDVHANPRRFRRMAVGRVLETALGMSRRFGRHGYRIAIVWYDTRGRASRRLRAEIDRVRMRIGGEVEVVAETWQSLCDTLGSAGGADGRYTRALTGRYFDLP